uniref:Uncharacterized protein n=1 Tax=Arundo donax TaxID=35708 RepID=A0A0A9H7X1_ARUDO
MIFIVCTEISCLMSKFFFLYACSRFCSSQGPMPLACQLGLTSRCY